ncbi:hypothetical protein [Sporosarcina sp. ZBG7A]|uniref:hypothetical protein n=1 Tax=Sporosarcina sp. ZBG7A TaxID=1582223 RepID=UPI000A4CBEB4|nr:hypothetical protein [Sporosarcina sp. ZBG7A]
MGELIGIAEQFNCFKELIGSASLLLVGLCTPTLRNRQYGVDYRHYRAKYRQVHCLNRQDG